jgi:cytochrome bd-type quinol oxidase subunit 1
VGAPECVGFYSLGMRFPFGLGWPGFRSDHVLFGKYFPFLGLLAFWFESFFLGLGDLFTSSYLLF